MPAANSRANMGLGHTSMLGEDPMPGGTRSDMGLGRVRTVLALMKSANWCSSTLTMTACCIMGVNGGLCGIPMPAANSRANMGLAIKSGECLRNLTCLKSLACLICLIMPNMTSERAPHALMGGIVIVIISIIIIVGACK